MILPGNDLIIKADGVAIAASKSCEIQINAKEIETAPTSNGNWETSILGRKSWRVTTNHLVVSMVKSAQMAGTTVSLSMEMRGNIGLSFGGFVDNVNILQQSWSGAGTIKWDKTNKKFCIEVMTLQGNVYYANWNDSTPYATPSDYDLFSYNGVTYVWYSSTLSAEKMTGQAHVVTWKGTFTKGNLSQGSFEFKGTGPLTPASLPSTT